MLPVCFLSAVWPQTPTTQATLYQRPDCWKRFMVLLVKDVIKPPGTYFNNWLQLSCRSSKFSSPFPATSVLLYAPLDPVREPAKCFARLSKQVKRTPQDSINELIIWKMNPFIVVPVTGDNLRELVNLVPRAFPLKNGWGGKRPWHRLVTCPLVHPKILGVIN